MAQAVLEAWLASDKMAEETSSREAVVVQAMAVAAAAAVAVEMAVAAVHSQLSSRQAAGQADQYIHTAVKVD